MARLSLEEIFGQPQVNGRPSLDEIFGVQTDSRPSLDEIFGEEKQARPSLDEIFAVNQHAKVVQCRRAKVGHFF